MNKLYIVRHGQTNWNKEKILQGHADIKLNEEGIKEANIVKDILNDISFDVVYSSPLLRAYDTAKIITNKDIIVDNRLIERCNGIFEGSKKEELPKDIDFNNDIICNKYNIELPEDITKRVKSFFDYISDTYDNKNILIVTHAGVSINIRILFEGLPKNNDYASYKLKNCEVLKYEC